MCEHIRVHLIAVDYLSWITIINLIMLYYTITNLILRTVFHMVVYSYASFFDKFSQRVCFVFNALCTVIYLRFCIILTISSKQLQFNKDTLLIPMRRFWTEWDKTKNYVDLTLNFGKGCLGFLIFFQVFVTNLIIFTSCVTPRIISIHRQLTGWAILSVHVVTWIC